MAAPVYRITTLPAKTRRHNDRSRRVIAYHLEFGYHREAEYHSPGWHTWYPHELHRGYQVKTADLILGPKVCPGTRRPY